MKKNIETDYFKTLGFQGFQLLYYACMNSSSLFPVVCDSAMAKYKIMQDLGWVTLKYDYAGLWVTITSLGILELRNFTKSLKKKRGQ